MFQAIEKSRILCLIRRGIYGCDWVNTLISAVLSQTFGPLAGRMVPGTPVMILRNDYAMGLFNGDVGIALCDRQGIERVFFRKPDGYLEFAMDGLPPWEPAFAMTVHKSQGSEFGDVLLVLPESADHRLLTREMIYTAVTRAKKRVIIYGGQEALLGAIGKRIQRQTGMLWESD
jgi:exodeoxyribonuclease V alpha subunit